MEKIRIRNFGPVHDVEIDLEKNFQIFIGTQASGKSTICKAIYFCKKIGDYTSEYLKEGIQFTIDSSDNYNNYLKFLTRKFMGCFGTTKHMQKFQIRYEWDNNYVCIHLNKEGFVLFDFSEELQSKISTLIQDVGDIYVQNMIDEIFGSLMNNLNQVAELHRQIDSMLKKCFQSKEKVVYIPAGRSVLAIMSEQLQGFSISQMDSTMQEFISLIQDKKKFCRNKLSDIAKEYVQTVSSEINDEALEQAYEIIKSVLKADYTNEGDGEKIYFDETHWVKLMYGSSGQQEILWILQIIYLIILENQKTFLILEEPEAHLFPEAQKKIIELVALMINTTDSTVIITTHSPYILTSANVLLYSSLVEKEDAEKSAVIPKNERLNFERAEAYKVGVDGNGKHFVDSIMDEETHMIYTEYIDSVSDITNEELEKLLELGE